MRLHNLVPDLRGGVHSSAPAHFSWRPTCSRGSTKVPSPILVMGPGRLAATSRMMCDTAGRLGMIRHDVWLCQCRPEPVRGGA